MSHVQYTTERFDPVVKPGEYVAMPANIYWTDFRYFRVVAVEPIDNFVIVLAPRDLYQPRVSKLRANAVTDIENPEELRLSHYELLQVVVKVVNFPLKFRVKVGNEAVMPSVSTLSNMWFDWNTPLHEMTLYFTGAKVLEGNAPQYTIEVYNPWSFDVPSDTAPVKTPPVIAMVLSGYRFIIEEVKEKPEHYTVIPVVPFVAKYRGVRE